MKTHERHARASVLRLTVGLLLLAACRIPGNGSPQPPQGPERPPLESAAAETGFTGAWDTTYGTMRLVERDAHVTGTYLWDGRAEIEGQRDGRLLRATYAESDGTRGRAVFELAEDGASFRGRWREGLEGTVELDDPEASRWRGTRLVPVPGRTWLVILEAHWEESLGEHEYSYGDMLRAFFERVPAVEVRQRSFHDQDDLVRFCHELSGLLEPVVLYISSHGTTAGVAVAGETIDGAAIGAALRGLDTLALLHFGSCEVLAGNEPAALLAAAGPEAAFPISGFRVAVDWAGSAIVDFAYLSLVLEQDLAPAAAVRATRAMLSFAGPPRADGLPIAGADLVLWGE